MSRRLPRGQVTFAFVDVVESTRIFAEHGQAFVTALAALQDRIARHTRAAGGAVVKTEGDGAFLAFPTARAAIDALVGLQDELALSAESTPRLAARAGAHSGQAIPVADDYVSLAVNVASRVAATAGPGQVVVSSATQAELASPAGVCLGDYDLKDVVDPVELWRVCGDDAPLRAAPARRTNVRIPVTEFVGREAELVALHDRVRSHQLVTVLGPGGLGKTRLASELVLQIAHGIDGGAWLVELASLASGDQIPAAVGQVLGVQAGDHGAVAAELRRRGPVVLVMDNCEHVLDAAADAVVELTETCPELRVICTSREPLQIPQEVVWRLPPLSDQAARVQLFAQRARASGATLAEGSEAVVDRLCTALDGLPLAIELAATQSGSTSVEELIRIAEHGTDELARRGDHTRLRSLDAVVAWSLDCLPAPRRASLLVLSVLPGRFDLEMATAVLSSVEACEPDAVRPLARASLIDLDGESYRILDTIRHAARRHLANDPDLSRAARLGLRSWAQQVAAALYRVQRDYSDEPIDRLLALETALEQAMDDGATGIGMLWELVRETSAYREPSNRVIDLAHRVLSGPLPSDSDDDLCFACAFDVLAQAGLLPPMDDRLEAVCAAADGHGVSFASADLHYRLAWHYATRGEVDAARRHADAYLPYADRPGADDIDRSLVHGMRSVIAQAAGEWEEALLHAERELQYSRKFASDIDLGTSEGNLAEALLDAGRPEDALLHAAEAVRLIPVPSPRRRFMLLQLARAQAHLGDEEAAGATAREIETELRESGRPPERVQAEVADLREQLPMLAVPGLQAEEV